MVAIIVIILLFVVCVGGCTWLSLAIFDSIFGTSERPPKTPTIHNHYYHTENHLHVNKDDLQNFIDT